MTALLMRVFGALFLLLATLGVVLPLLPTTPFLLLAAACFARGSERWHQWLLSSRLFGPFLSRWESQRCVNCRTKWVALGSMLVCGSVSLGAHDMSAGLRLFGIALILIGAVVVLRLKRCPVSVDSPARV
ncbi:YbaN family protein [Spongiibacter taiwanensis]|uniref:YbaN family protein n=1 Tax=Spongiibacter taiwanensis TaxID=1748242 RepID=UPI0020354623|nr:YbaN family protein [Spongiibacter taiwanensis]USA42763.1 YbaN family protein [Spongiibacter taiwanensis]